MFIPAAVQGVYWPIPVRQPRLELECPCFSKCTWLNVIEAHFGRVQNSKGKIWSNLYLVCPWALSQVVILAGWIPLFVGWIFIVWSKHIETQFLMVNNPSTIQIGKSGSPFKISNLYQLYRSLPTWFSTCWFSPLIPRNLGPRLKGRVRRRSKGTQKWCFLQGAYGKI